MSADENLHLFNLVYDETFDDVRKYIALKCADVSYIADILQETYLEFYRLVMRKGADYINDSRALLFKIAKRKVYSYYSLKDRLKSFIPLNEDVPIEAMQIDDCMLDAILDTIEAQRIWDIVKTYPRDIHKIFHLYFYEGLTLAEIASTLGYSLSSVKNKLYRTLLEIRERENGNE